MEKNNSQRVGAHFDSDWSLYQQSIHNNMLYHQEMFAALKNFLNTHFENTPFTLADLGCGDGSAIVNTLLTTRIKKYIGVDTAPTLMTDASKVLANLHCEKEFFGEDMVTALPKLPEVNILFSSYAIHHLNTEQKESFLNDCHQKLPNGGYLVMIDGVIASNQTLDEWRDALEARFFTVLPHVSREEGRKFLQHSRTDDFPDSIATFRDIAKKQGWKNFDVLVDKTIFAFMVFTK